MNRVVRLGDLLVRQGVFAFVVSCVFSTAVLGQQPNAPSQTVPDAPVPQQNDNLGNLSSGVTPGKGAQAPAPDQGTNTPQVPAANTPAQSSTQDQQPQETP